MNPIFYFQGQDDHKFPVHNQAPMQAGILKIIVRILSLAFLHDGPWQGGLFREVKYFFT
jgi:hypothetical protein